MKFVISCNFEVSLLVYGARHAITLAEELV